MYDHGAFKARVDKALDEFVRQETAELTAIHDDLAPVATQLAAAISGGKRLRAAFCYWGWRAAGQADCDEMVRAAASMELLHSAAIVHDDIIDESHTRRGVPTAHIALRTAIADPEQRDFRAGALAILVGDLLMGWAGQLFTGSGLPGAYLGRTKKLWATLGRELIAGECLEIMATGAATEHSLKIIRFKTAKYSVERPLHLGAALGGASPGLLGTFTDYGVPLGEAYQLKDDLLGVYGDPRKTGKSNTDDVRGRKPTALVSTALLEAGSADRAELEELLGRPDPGPDDLLAVQRLLDGTGARERIEEMIRDRAELAARAVERRRLPQEAAEALLALVSAVVDRES